MGLVISVHLTPLTVSDFRVNPSRYPYDIYAVMVPDEYPMDTCFVSTAAIMLILALCFLKGN